MDRTDKNRDTHASLPASDTSVVDTEAHCYLECALEWNSLVPSHEVV